MNRLVINRTEHVSMYQTTVTNGKDLHTRLLCVHGLEASIPVKPVIKGIKQDSNLPLTCPTLAKGNSFPE